MAQVFPILVMKLRSSEGATGPTIMQGIGVYRGVLVGKPILMPIQNSSRCRVRFLRLGKGANPQRLGS